jgi:hypothetical protein
MTNLCRDEVTTVLKDKIEGVFGGSFNTNGLGAVLTCGVTGIKAGLSHSPLSVVSTRACGAGWAGAGAPAWALGGGPRGPTPGGSGSSMLLAACPSDMA